MHKKLLFAVLMVVSLFLCSSAVNKAITYDNDFIKSLARGLDCLLYTSDAADE